MSDAWLHAVGRHSVCGWCLDAVPFFEGRDSRGGRAFPVVQLYHTQLIGHWSRAATVTYVLRTKKHVRLCGSSTTNWTCSVGMHALFCAIKSPPQGLPLGSGLGSSAASAAAAAWAVNGLFGSPVSKAGLITAGETQSLPVRMYFMYS